MKLLVVEDNEMSTELILAVLELGEMEADAATDGAQALGRFEDGLYDLVLMDINLPDVHGAELLKQMKRLQPRVPMIALTAYAMEGDRERLISAGFDGYISKPIDVDPFLETVKALAQKS